MTLRFLPAAEADVAAAIAWYDAQSDGLGGAVLEELNATLERILTGPQRYPKVQGSTRRALLRRFPYAVYFREESGQIVIFAVFHQRRGPQALRARIDNPSSTL